MPDPQAWKQLRDHIRNYDGLRQMGSVWPGPVLGVEMREFGLAETLHI